MGQDLLLSLAGQLADFEPRICGLKITDYLLVPRFSLGPISCYHSQLALFRPPVITRNCLLEPPTIGRIWLEDILLSVALYPTIGRN
jgi:hypothetical protein